VVVPKALVDVIAPLAVEQEQFEAWVVGEVEAGAELPGLYPPSAETKQRYEAARHFGPGSGG
jgi:hypothetical protein